MSKEHIGQYYWGVRIVRDRKKRLLNFFADKIDIRGGDLLIFGHMHDEPAGSFMYRSLAHGTWSDVYAASCLDGSECGEDHDIEISTGEDLRYSCTD